MADQSTAFLQQPQFLDPEQQQQLNEIARKQRMAQLLTQTGMTPVQGQMVGNRFVAPAWSQYANQLFSAYSGRKTAEEAESMQTKLAQALKGQQAAEITKFNELLKTDPNAAYTYAAQSNVPELKAVGLKKMLPQELTLKPGERHITVSPTGEQKVVAEVPEKPIVVGNNLVDPATGKVIYTAPKDFAGHVLETDNGPMLVDTRTGRATPITAGGQPVTGGKPLTESQSNATAFGIRAKEANLILKGLEDKGYRTGGVIKGTAESIPLIGGALGKTLNWTAGDEQQATSQARKNFVTAVLRKESGASISPTEFENEEKKYFPQVGDSAAVVLQKQKARETAIKALELQAGPGARQIQAHNPSLEDIAPAAAPSKNQGWRLK